jgi:hypothetical protein
MRIWLNVRPSEETVKKTKVTVRCMKKDEPKCAMRSLKQITDPYMASGAIIATSTSFNVNTLYLKTQNWL